MGRYVMSTNIHCTWLIYLEYYPLAIGPTRNLPSGIRAKVAAVFPKLYPTLMLVCTSTSDEIHIVVAIVRAGARHMGSGVLGYGLDTDTVGRM